MIPMGNAPPFCRPRSPGKPWAVEARVLMAKPLQMFTRTDVRDALESLADTSRRRRAAWLVERLKQDSEHMPPGELLVEIISSAILLGAEPTPSVSGLPSLLDG